MKLLILVLICGIATAQFMDYDEFVPDKNVKAKKNKAMKGSNMGRFGKGRMPMPTFLENATDETKKEVRDILMNKDLSREEIDSKIEQVLKKDRPEVQEAFELFKSEVEARRKQRLREHEKKRERLSEDAQLADSKLIEILEDPTLTMSDRHEKMRQVFEGLSDSIKKELKNMRKEKKENKKNAFKLENRPMRRLRYRPEEKMVETPAEIETKPIRTSEDGQFLEI
ncbi:unnamed protein product [Auanema sp. JU1783]|nr:unnamed protein product [Auanema sp. JU1783]